MSPAQSGIYQSQVFRFIVRQARQWRDRGQVAVRWLGIAVTWAAEAVWSSVYAVVKGIQLVGGGRQRMIAPAASELTNDHESESTLCLTASTSVEETLQLIQGLSLTTELQVWVEPAIANIAVTPGRWSDRLIHRIRERFNLRSLSSQASPIAYVRAIASLVSTRALVLVTNQNQVLDILTPEQQAQLEQRINWETNHYQRYLYLKQTRTEIRLSAQPSEQPATAPNRLFQRIRAVLKSASSSLAVLIRRNSSVVPVHETSAIVNATTTSASLTVSEVALPASLALACEVNDNTTPAPAPWKYSALDPVPTWDCIDTEAVPMGYVLEPLDQILRWVDRSLVWIEGQLGRLWRWIRQQQWLVNMRQHIQRFLQR